jgi:tetratricopeptide (TPR) repeat protein
VSIDPSEEAYNRLGDIFQASNDCSRAETAYRRAVALNIYDPHAHFGLAQALEATGKPDDALHEFESGLQLDPSDLAARAAAIRLRGNTPPQAIPR